VPRCSSWIKRDPQLTFQIFPEQGKQVSLINKFGQKECIDRRKACILKLRIGKPVTKASKKRKILKKLQYLQIHEVINGLHSEHVHPLIHTLKLQCHLKIPHISRYSI
ncbi:hypothetical protein NQ318_020479, partial [Aromia moschata]